MYNAAVLLPEALSSRGGGLPGGDARQLRNGSSSMYGIVDGSKALEAPDAHETALCRLTRD